MAATARWQSRFFGTGRWTWHALHAEIWPFSYTAMWHRKLWPLWPLQCEKHCGLSSLTGEATEAQSARFWEISRKRSRPVVARDNSARQIWKFYRSMDEYVTTWHNVQSMSRSFYASLSWKAETSPHFWRVGSPRRSKQPHLRRTGSGIDRSWSRHCHSAVVTVDVVCCCPCSSSCSLRCCSGNLSGWRLPSLFWLGSNLCRTSLCQRGICAGRSGGYPSAQGYPSYTVRGGYSKDSIESNDAGQRELTVALVGWDWTPQKYWKHSDVHCACFSWLS